MRADRVVIEPFAYDSIGELEIKKEIGSHATACVSGILEKGADEGLLERISPDETATIKAISMDGEETVLFRGLIENISLKTEAGLKSLKFTAISHTCLLDRKKQARVFQDTEASFRDIAKYIGEENGARVICTEGKEEKTGRLIVQYQETDWAFLKRIASMIHTVIVADHGSGRVSFSLGMPKLKKGELGDILSQAVRSLDGACQAESGTAYRKDGALVFQVETREALELCTPVYFQGRDCVICKATGRLEGKELIHVYELARTGDIRTAERMNAEISGTSLDGTVYEVSNDCLKVRFPEDVHKPAVWFPYATVYSSPDGTGWYCMPEKGDAVRVYFQDFDERKAVAFNSIHLACGLREDPEIQYIRSPHDKEIRFEPSAIRITNHQGISVVLDDKKGITLESASDIVAIAGGDIDIQSQRELNVTGDKGIMIRQGDNRIEVKDGIRQVAREIWQR
ncbi:MAG: hypothetical protein HFG46_13260 [Clostridium sp.]|nr:hypothetical protein [Clostridium sp.]